MQPRQPIELLQGPRQKSLATYHVEYLAYCMLLIPNEVNIYTREHQILVDVMGRRFNLTNIFAAYPDFEQLIFCEYALDKYYVDGYVDQQKLNAKPHWHNAETLAVIKWTSHDFKKMNAMLRAHEENDFQGDVSNLRVQSSPAKPV